MITSNPLSLQGLSEPEVQALPWPGPGQQRTARHRPHLRPDRPRERLHVHQQRDFSAGPGAGAGGPAHGRAVSVGIIITNMIVSVVQEMRAKRMLDRIALLTRPRATVVRDGQERVVPPEELVLGDVLRVGPGDQVLLDGVVLGRQDASGRVAAHRRVRSGRQRAGRQGLLRQFLRQRRRVLSWQKKSGEASLANQLTASARAYRRVLTPLQTDINLAIRVILVIVIYLELLIIANGLIKAIPLPEGVQQATVIAGLVPNGLFVAIAVAYALAAVRIVRFGALVQQANAVESLSNVDVLCLDKTGTLTTNRLRMEAYLSARAG